MRRGRQDVDVAVRYGNAVRYGTTRWWLERDGLQDQVEPGDPASYYQLHGYWLGLSPWRLRRLPNMAVQVASAS